MSAVPPKAAARLLPTGAAAKGQKQYYWGHPQLYQA